MSEERRKRQMEREGGGEANPQARKFLLWGGIALLFVAVYAAGWYRKNHHYDPFAKCLATKQAKMYGLYWCPHCIEQKEKFGASFQYIPYQECAIKGQPGMVAECKAAGAAHFPSWQFNGGPLEEGVLSMEDLSSRTGCSLP
jgi:hypothetical protein